ncbi:MAG: hypothetical protein NUV75_01940 [Gallionella sp.]|nr:hypothetical protein [Gallionella sp.]
MNIKPSEEVLAMARRIVDAKGDMQRDSAHDDCADQVAAELLRLAALLSEAI